MEDFEGALACLEEQREVATGINPLLRQAYEAALRSQLGDLKAQAEEYERRQK